MRRIYFIFIVGDIVLTILRKFSDKSQLELSV